MRVPSHKFYFVIFIIKVFIGILGESFEILFLAICYIDFDKGFNQSWNMFLIFLLLEFFIGTLGAPKYKMPPNNKNRSLCLPFGGVLYASGG